MFVSRSQRALQLAFFLVLLFLLTEWVHEPKKARLPSSVKKVASRLRFSIADDIFVESETDLNDQSTSSEQEPSPHDISTSKYRVKTSPSFRLLISNATRSPGLCRTILSAEILGYPSPTLIDYFDERQGQDEETTSSETNGDQNTILKRKFVVDKVQDEITAIDEYLQRSNSTFRKDDLVLILQSGQSWVQLPPNVFAHRYEKASIRANTWWRRKHGHKLENTLEKNLIKHSIVTGARQNCWLGSNHPDCQSIPSSPVIVGPYKYPGPKYLGGGVIAGTFGELQSLTKMAAAEVQRAGEPSQESLSRIFGEQETNRLLKLGSKSKFQRLKEMMRLEETALEIGSKYIGMPSKPNADKELGLFLDYDFSLIQTKSQAGNVDWVDFKDDSKNDTIAANDRHIKFPADLASAGPPWRLSTTTGTDEKYNTSALSFNETLDNLPSRMTWTNLSLAVNSDTLTVPAILHFDKKKGQALDDHWRQMWFHPWARALMRNRLRISEGTVAAHMAALGGEDGWDLRGGTGGVWTAEGQWLEFGEVCRGYENELFGDDLGEWGLEGGRMPHCFKSGELWAGEGDCPVPDDIEEEEEHSQDQNPGEEQSEEEHIEEQET